MKISKLLSIAILSLGLSLTASAAEFRVLLSTLGESADGTFRSLSVDQGGTKGVLVYELVPGTPTVATVLRTNRCPDGYRLDASVILRENQTVASGLLTVRQEIVRLLVRKIGCIAP